MIRSHASWEIKGTAILTELVHLMDVSPDEAALLAALQDKARAAAAAMTTAFYRRLRAHSSTLEYLAGASAERLNALLADWFIGLFCGNYDEDYANQRLSIGAIHVRIGLPVRYPLAMLDVIMPYGEQVAAQSPQPEQALKAFRKVLALDIALFNQAYVDNQLHYLAELVGGERLARLLLTGAG
jgi:hypothetical protein